jgi:hypothetical protein
MQRKRRAWSGPRRMRSRQPVMIGRSASISPAMKSKNALTRGVRRNSGVVSRRQMRELGDRLDHSDEIRFGVAQGNGQRRHADPCLGRIDPPEHAVAARRNRRVGRHLAQPGRDAVPGHRVIELDQRVLCQASIRSGRPWRSM